jgi:hypothetical protein
MTTRLSAAAALMLVFGLIGQETFAQKGSRTVRRVFYVSDLSTGAPAQITSGEVIVTAGSDVYIGTISGRHSKATVDMPSSVTSATVTVDAPGFCAQPQTYTNFDDFCRNCLAVYVSPCSP